MRSLTRNHGDTPAETLARTRKRSHAQSHSRAVTHTNARAFRGESATPALSAPQSSTRRHSPTNTQTNTHTHTHTCTHAHTHTRSHARAREGLRSDAPTIAIVPALRRWSTRSSSADPRASSTLRSKCAHAAKPFLHAPSLVALRSSDLSDLPLRSVPLPSAFPRVPLLARPAASLPRSPRDPLPPTSRYEPPLERALSLFHGFSQAECQRVLQPKLEVEPRPSPGPDAGGAGPSPCADRGCPPGRYASPPSSKTAEAFSGTAPRLVEYPGVPLSP
jgi:hypothetical protein